MSSSKHSSSHHRHHRQQSSKDSSKNSSSKRSYIQWVDKFDRDSAGLLVVTKAIVAGHTPFASEQGSSVYVNHWCLYLSVSETNTDGQLKPAGSVRLDMVPTGGNNGEAHLVISRLSFEVSNGVVCEVSAPAVPNLRASHVIDHLCTNGRQRFQYGPKGLECRHWTWQCVTDIGH